MINLKKYAYHMLDVASEGPGTPTVHDCLPGPIRCIPGTTFLKSEQSN